MALKHISLEISLKVLALKLLVTHTDGKANTCAHTHTHTHMYKHWTPLNGRLSTPFASRLLVWPTFRAKLNTFVLIF